MGLITETIGGLGAMAYAFLGGALSSLTDSLSKSSDSYRPSAAITVESSKSEAEKLAELKAGCRNVTEKKEKQILDYINESMDELFKILENVNKQSFGGKILNINVAEIKSKNDNLKKEVIGCIGNYIDGRLVLTDKELSKILEERNDKKRKKKFDIFYEKIREQAVERLKSKIEITVHKQEEIIRKEIRSRLSEIDKKMRETTKAYEEILHMKEEQDDEKIEEKQIQYCYEYELAEILLEQIEN